MENVLHRDSSLAWVVQDFAGVAVCMICLSVLQLPNLQVASVLLCLAFFYDVFFVFITPYIFSSSIMEKVFNIEKMCSYYFITIMRFKN